MTVQFLHDKSPRRCILLDNCALDYDKDIRVSSLDKVCGVKRIGLTRKGVRPPDLNYADDLLPSRGGDIVYEIEDISYSPHKHAAHAAHAYVER